MATLWMCLSLLFAAILLSRALAELPAHCGPNNTVEATAGGNLTVHCSVDSSQVESECKIEKYQWSAHDNIICSDNMKKDMEKDKENKTNQIYSCGLDKSMRELYLNIPRIKKVEEGIYKSSAQTNCGTVSATVTVTVTVPGKAVDKETDVEFTTRHAVDKETDVGFTTWHLFPIVGTLGAVGILAFLFFTQRGRKIIDNVRKKMSNSHLSNTDPCNEAASEPLNV